MQITFRNWWPSKKLFLKTCSIIQSPGDGSKYLLIWWGTQMVATLCFIISRLVAGPSESQLQNTWWRAEFPSLNWVVCLSHWSPLPGKRFRFCAKTGETLHLGLFLRSPCSLLPSSLLVSQPGGSSTGENDWQVSVGDGQCLCGGSRFTFGADGQACSCQNLQPLLQGRIFFSGFVLMPQALFNIFFSLQDETVDLRYIYFSVAALSGLVSFKSLLHTAFPVRTFP